MRKFVCYAGAFLLILHHFGGFLFAQEMFQILDDPLFIVEDATPNLEENIDIPESPEDDIVSGKDVVNTDTSNNEDVYDSSLSSSYIISDTGDTQTINVTPKLLITEVYFAGTDEWFEIYNADDNILTGVIQIVGVKSSTLTINDVNIPSNTAVIFGDNMSMILDSSVISHAGLGLSITDTNPLDISLLYDSQIIDTFVAGIDQMATAKSQKASLQKILDDGDIVSISLSEHNYNNQDDYNINPGIVYSSFEQEPPADCEERGGTIQISEIFLGDSQYSPYIELYAPSGFNGTITISGTQIQESIDVVLNQPAGHYFVLTQTGTGYDILPYHTDNQKLSFSSELGNVVIYGQSGQVLDKVDIKMKEDGYSSYIHGVGCQRQADSINTYSPGFPFEYLSYFPEGVDNVITVTQQIVVPNSENSCSSSTGENGVDATATGDFVMNIASVEYDPEGSDTNRETITLQSSVDYPLDLSVYALRLSTRDGLQYLRGVLEPEEEITLTGNFRFPNAGACIDLLYGDFVVDTYCYPVAGGGTGEIENDYSDLAITIDSLLYDPPGNDTDNEEISFTIKSGSVDFSDGFYVLINGRKYNLTSFGGVRTGTFSLKANYRMPNTKDACVSLMQGDFVFDTKCYSIPISINIPSNFEQDSINTQRFDYNIKITHIDYNPDGLDTNNEKITLSMSTGGQVDLSQFYILINGTKRKLKESLVSGQSLTLVGNYGFPNTKQTCVTLQYQDHVYDTYCYDPNKEKEELPISLYTGVTLTFLSVLPNPIGTDSNKEQIKILLHSPNVVDLSQGFDLMIGTAKKKISGIIYSGEEYILTGSFTLPNTASCLSLMYSGVALDIFCYPQPKEGIVYTKNEESLSILDDNNLSLLNKATLDVFNSKICLTLSEVIIKCRNIPAGKLAKKQYEELKLSRNYINMIHDYLYNHWQVFYFNTDIASYEKLFNTAKQDISSNIFYQKYGSEKIATADIQTRFHLQYEQPLLQQLQAELSTKLFGEKLKQNYQKAKERYYKNINE